MKPNLFTRLFTRTKPQNHTGNLPITTLDTTDLFSLRTMTHYGSDNYENGYSSVRAIANRFMTLRPYAIDANGKPMDRANLIDVLARPNQAMSGVDFRDALAVMSMVHDKVYLLVYERRGSEIIPATENVREDRIAGFNFLENVQEEYFDGQIQYRVNVKTQTGSTSQIFYPYQVIVIQDVNPDNLSGGYSPARAAARWTRIDDYIADYQSGFFENGAVPSGQFVITAPTSQDFEDIVDGLKSKHQGAGKNNNIVYTYQPIDPGTGKAAQATITWVPFNTSNKDMSLDTLFEQANKKIDSVYGVSAFIRAIDEAPNFATAQVIERNFVENTVRPFAIKKWGRFQHELNRITGGLNYGISFKLDTPHIADEEKAEAETNNIRVTTLNALITTGFTLDSAINALQLPNNWKLLEMGDNMNTTIENDKEEVDEGNEADDAPAAPQVHTHSIVNQLADESKENFALRIEATARDLMTAQIESTIKGLDAQNAGDATEEELAKFIADMMIIISEIMLIEGISQYEAGKLLLLESGINTAGQSYKLSEEALNRYRAYLKNVGDSYSLDTKKAIQATLDLANTEGLPRVELEKKLRNIMQTDDYRITRLGVSETNRSQQMGSLEAMNTIADENDITMAKIWNTSSTKPCPYCQSLDGTQVGITENFVDKGANIEGTDGSLYLNDFVDMEVSQVHPNDRCYLTYKVLSSTTTNKLEPTTRLTSPCLEAGIIL